MHKGSGFSHAPREQILAVRSLRRRGRVDDVGVLVSSRQKIPHSLKIVQISPVGSIGSI